MNRLLFLSLGIPQEYAASPRNKTSSNEVSENKSIRHETLFISIKFLNIFHLFRTSFFAYNGKIYISLFYLVCRENTKLIPTFFHQTVCKNPEVTIPIFVIIRYLQVMFVIFVSVTNSKA